MLLFIFQLLLSNKLRLFFLFPKFMIIKVSTFFLFWPHFCHLVAINPVPIFLFVFFCLFLFASKRNSQNEQLVSCLSFLCVSWNNLVKVGPIHIAFTRRLVAKFWFHSKLPTFVLWFSTSHLFFTLSIQSSTKSFSFQFGPMVKSTTPTYSIVTLVQLDVCTF